ncbi:hypothetical protein Tco_0839043 [Tanacetum coccineum]|uniref:Uncharacterized protein n=1 Tax=Tanacetum coccineum TaxID=301880 RepID=A0ABQ5APJ0_9ASTR
MDDSALKLSYKSVGIYRLKSPHKFRKQLTITFLLKLMRDQERILKMRCSSEREKRAKRRRHLSTKCMCLESHHLDKSMKRNEVLLLQMKQQYHIDQMKNFLQSDIVWESRKEIIVSLHPRKTTPLVQSCQRDPEAPALSLINQDLFVKKFKSLSRDMVELWKKSSMQNLLHTEDKKEPVTKGKDEILQEEINDSLCRLPSLMYSRISIRKDNEDMYLIYYVMARCPTMQKQGCYGLYQYSSEVQ